MNHGSGKAAADEDRKQARSGSEVDDALGVWRDEVDCPAVEAVAAGNEAGAVLVVGGGGGVEDVTGSVGRHRSTIRNSSTEWNIYKKIEWGYDCLTASRRRR